VSACASGAHAIGLATREIQAGAADAVLAGGAEASLTPLAFAAFHAASAMSPTGVSRPWDTRRDGFVMGEGAGILVLEEADAARVRGARVLGEVCGYATTSDAHHITAPHPHGAGATRAMALALKDAGLAPEDIDYINAHGTSTQLNDRVEAHAIQAALQLDDPGRLKVSSTKSAIGHLFGAAGAVEAIATLLALRDRIAPPTLNLEHLEDDLPPFDFVPGQARPLNTPADRPARALSNAFGFGGHNAVLALAA